MSKGVSEIVASILLIAIVTAVGLSLLLYGMGYFSDLSTANQAANNQNINALNEHFVVVDAVVANYTLVGSTYNYGLVNATVYNYGTVNVKITGLYVNGKPTFNGPPVLIVPGATGTIYSTANFTTSNSTVQVIVRVISSLGNYNDGVFWPGAF